MDGGPLRTLWFRNRSDSLWRRQVDFPSEHPEDRSALWGFQEGLLRISTNCWSLSLMLV